MLNFLRYRGVSNHIVATARSPGNVLAVDDVVVVVRLLPAYWGYVVLYCRASCVLWSVSCVLLSCSDLVWWLST